MGLLARLFGKRRAPSGETGQPSLAISSDFHDRDSDPWFWSHYDDVPAIILSIVSKDSVAAGRRIVDFGCGDGIAALGVASRIEGLVTGIDLYRTYARLPEYIAKNLGERPLPANLSFLQNELGKALPLDDSTVDLVYSWSVFEHVANVPGILAELHRILKPGAALFIQVDPLYYSPFGSHLQRLVDEPWAHLLFSEDEYLRMASSASDRIAEEERDTLYRTHQFEDLKRYLVGEYKSLNRITADELIATVTRAGFEISTQRLFKVDGLVPDPRLLSRYSEDLLMTNQVVLTARKA
jgi:ubiquinone/menaquinone biosynthesis C-methylase UbiE